MLTLTLLILPFLPETLFTGFPFDPIPLKVPSPSTKHGWNDILSREAELLFPGQIVGPESLALKDNFIYTGLADGRIVEVDLKLLKIRTVTRFALPNTQQVCGKLIIIATLIALRHRHHRLCLIFSSPYR